MVQCCISTESINNIFNNVRQEVRNIGSHAKHGFIVLANASSKVVNSVQALSDALKTVVSVINLLAAARITHKSWDAIKYSVANYKTVVMATRSFVDLDYFLGAFGAKSIGRTDQEKVPEENDLRNKPVKFVSKTILAASNFLTIFEVLHGVGVGAAGWLGRFAAGVGKVRFFKYTFPVALGPISTALALVGVAGLAIDSAIAFAQNREGKRAVHALDFIGCAADVALLAVATFLATAAQAATGGSLFIMMSLAGLISGSTGIASFLLDDYLDSKKT